MCPQLCPHAAHAGNDNSIARPAILAKNPQEDEQQDDAGRQQGAEANARRGAGRCAWRSGYGLVQQLRITQARARYPDRRLGAAFAKVQFGTTRPDGCAHARLAQVDRDARQDLDALLRSKTDLSPLHRKASY